MEHLEKKQVGSEKELFERFSDFFDEVKIPQKLKNLEMLSLDLFDSEEAKEIIFEKDPQSFIGKTAKIETSDGRAMAVGLLEIKKEMCMGHFSFGFMAPLALVAQALAQVGEFLIVEILNGENKKKIPPVAKLNSMKSSSRAKKPVVPIPGDVLLVIAEHKGGRFNLNFLSIEAYIEGDLNVEIEDISYSSIDKEDLISIINNQERERKNEKSLV